MFSNGPDERVEYVLSFEVLPHIIQRLNSESPDVITPTLRIIGNIVTCDDSITQVCIF